jgi:signal transduction histidine kinase
LCGYASFPAWDGACGVEHPHTHLLEETGALRAFAEAVPLPVWARSNNGALSFANAAYARPPMRARSRMPSNAISNCWITTIAPAWRSTRERHLIRSTVPIVTGGQRRMFDICALNVIGGSAGIAVDATEAASLRAALERMAEAHRRMLDQLSSGVAVFDASRRLTFYNDSYRRLWISIGLSSMIIRMIRPCSTGFASPAGFEQPDFRAWKNKLFEAYRAIEPAKDTWYLPDGRALSVVTTPNPEGGVTYLFDDVTESLKLARQNDGLIRVQRETLDNLAEAVAVFGSNGRAQLFNPPFARMWKLSPEQLAQQPHIEAIEKWCRPLFDDDATWQTLRAAITGIDDRSSVPLRLERKDGSVLDCTTMPLPDGATMLTFQDVTDTVNVERALRERNEALETADQMKIDFVHHMSYELRAPLTSIIGFAHFLGDPSTGPMTPKQSEYLSYITTSTDALLAISNNILDLATIDAGAMKLNLGPVDLRKTVEEATAGIQDRLARENIRLDVQIDPSIGDFVADERRIVQVLYNLLANAVGFSPSNSTVVLRARRNSSSVVFSVSDSGPGIPEEVKDKVFDWFESHANGSRHRGAGLGLSLVRSFVELHGGKVYVDSVVGKGTTVTCEFPADQTFRHAAE